ncbi:hypothetical protein C2G38_2156081 [Gigaspora rosea]|uniref:Uncharacterized protein n=1 Tax=Gigaspora rosea TaxID=44941 RepID=A0A397W6C6_9GLOM|nr:hypothetical protein C2G38_2156081 [Gigaspora rosea]
MNEESSFRQQVNVTELNSTPNSLFSQDEFGPEALASNIFLFLSRLTKQIERMVDGLKGLKMQKSMGEKKTKVHFIWNNII